MNLADSIPPRNALITKAWFDIERGCVVGWLSLDYGGSGQGFGGHVLYLPDDWAHAKGQFNLAGHFIYRCLKVAGVDRWDQIEGKTIRARADYMGVHAIGHILKEDWFCPADDFARMTGDRS